MGHLKRAHLEFQGYPDNLILDFEDIFWKMRRDVSLVWPHAVDWDEVLTILFQGVSVLENTARVETYPDHQTLFQNATDIAHSDSIFPGLYDPYKMDELYRVFKRAGLELKERLLILMAYQLGVFPYTFRTMISDGCLFFSKNESIYDTRVFDSGF